jgi:hypothetical protein
MNNIGKVVRIDEKQLKDSFDQYSETPKKELLTVFSLDKNGTIEWSIKPAEQEQAEHHVEFSTNVVHEWADKLQQEWHDVAAIGIDHNHNEDSNHDLHLSDADLVAAKKLHDELWVDHMALTMNGKTWADGKIAVQHKIVTDHTWELRTLEGDKGSGKVVTMYTDTDGQKKIEYSQSIEEAKALQEIVELKKQLMAA